jgi:hypothetical protein
MPAHRSCCPLNPAEQLRECDSVAGQRLNALMSTRNNTQGLNAAWRWVQQQKAAGAFRGEVIGPLGLEVKVKRGPHAERLAQNLEQVTLVGKLVLLGVSGSSSSSKLGDAA